MASKTEIANLAISHLGIGKEIANLDTDKSEEAVACRRFFDEARKATLRDFPWPFATKLFTLGLVADPPSETDEWDFSYRYPSDCLMIKRIPSGIRNDSNSTRVVYKIARDNVGQLIYTDQPQAKVEYTINETDPARFSSDFTLALSFRLAVYVAPRLTAGDPFKMGERAQRLYIFELTSAQASASNEEQPDTEPDSELIRARESGFLPPGRGGGRPFGT